MVNIDTHPRPTTGDPAPLVRYFGWLGVARCVAADRSLTQYAYPAWTTLLRVFRDELLWETPLMAPPALGPFPELQSNFAQTAAIILRTIRGHVEQCQPKDVPALLDWLSELYASAGAARRLGGPVLSLLASLVARHADALRPEAGRLAVVLLEVCRDGSTDLSTLREILALTQPVFHVAEAAAAAVGASAFDEAAAAPLLQALAAKGGWPDVELPLYLLSQIFGRTQAATQAALVARVVDMVAEASAAWADPAVSLRNLPGTAQLLRGVRWLLSAAVGASCPVLTLPLASGLWAFADSVCTSESAIMEIAEAALAESLACVTAVWGTLPAAELAAAIGAPVDAPPPDSLAGLLIAAAERLQAAGLWAVSSAVLAHAAPLAGSAAEAVAPVLGWRLKRAPRLAWRCADVLAPLSALPPSAWAAEPGRGLVRLLEDLLEHDEPEQRLGTMQLLREVCGLDAAPAGGAVVQALWPALVGVAASDRVLRLKLHAHGLLADCAAAGLASEAGLALLAQAAQAPFVLEGWADACPPPAAGTPTLAPRLMATAVAVSPSCAQHLPQVRTTPSWPRSWANFNSF
jgi:hypothetical protein